MIEMIVTTVKAKAAERLSATLTALQEDHGLTFSEAVETLRSALDNSYSDDDMPGGGYIVIT